MLSIQLKRELLTKHQQSAGKFGWWGARFLPNRNLIYSGDQTWDLSHSSSLNHWATAAHEPAYIVMGTSFENDGVWRKMTSKVVFAVDQRQTSNADVDWCQMTSFNLTRRIWCFLTNFVKVVENWQFSTIFKTSIVIKWRLLTSFYVDDRRILSNFVYICQYSSKFVKISRFQLKISNELHTSQKVNKVRFSDEFYKFQIFLFNKT